MTISAIAVISGHNWSLLVTMLTGKLRGGKGAATAFGTLLMVAPIQVLITMAILGGLVVFITRYVSLAVLLMMLMALVWMIVLVFQRQLEVWLLVYSLTLPVLLLMRFRENIQRLLSGTERRLGERA
jgi:glycerol-3-phosphate acyltransferase PlsY